MSTDAPQHQQILSFGSLSMAIPPIEVPGMNKLSPRVQPVGQREPWPKVIALEVQPISSNAGTAQLDSPKLQNQKAGITGLQKSSSMNKRSRKTTEVAPVTPKAVGSESCESVRLKMRESLSAALELVVNEQNKIMDASQQKGNSTESEKGVNRLCENIQLGDVRSGTGEIQNKSPDCSNLQVLQKGALLLDDGSSEVALMKDDFLQENGLCWASFVGSEESREQECHNSKKPKLSCDLIEESNNKKSQILALEIEEELYKLFGGVNRKYKEKGRSLMFNLKDRQNPELRQRVFSGEISPERLCAMSAEELASKELSEWRIAKAEELAQQIVLPETDIKYRMVKKTHKGEYQVEVENDDSASVEVTVDTSLLPQFNTNRSGNQNKRRKASQKDSESPFDVTLLKKSALHREKDPEEQLPLYNHNSGQPENADLMQYLITAESKDAGSLPPVPTLDDFMLELTSEPPFETLQDGAELDSPLSAEKSSDSFSRNSPDATNSVHLGSKLSPVSKASEVGSDSNTDLVNSDKNLGLGFPIKDSSNGEIVWEGLIQLNISSLVTALGFHKSGEQASTKEWPSFLEIKGRVKLDAFEKFLQELRLSRSRAIMVLQFCWKEGSPDSGRMKLCETVDSYIVDERVGFAEPAPGLELYFCPPHPKTTEVLISNLSKEHEETVGKVDDGLIGVLVWKKEASPRPPSHHRKQSRKHSHQRNGSERNPSANITTDTSSAPPATNEDEEIDDVPPGFGPAVISARDDDDLPEFSFALDRTKAGVSGFPASNTLNAHPIPPLPSSQPVEHLREMIQKYGSNLNEGSWKNDDDDDDIPEWRPDLPVSNPTNHPLPYQQAQRNPYANQLVNQFQAPPHRPPYPKAASQFQQNQFAPVPFGGVAASFGSSRPVGPRYPSVGGYGQNRKGWNPAFARNNRR